jgi:hypothetical protein
VSFVQLDRHFISWDDQEPAQVETRLLMGRLNGDLDWLQLLQKKWVVILAEVGAGKSEELKAQAVSQRAASNFAFYATVQNVANDGLSAALNAEDGSTAGRIQRNKGLFVEGYNVSIDSAMLLQAYLSHVIKEARLEFKSGTQDKKALDELFH